MPNTTQTNDYIFTPEDLYFKNTEVKQLLVPCSLDNGQEIAAKGFASLDSTVGLLEELIFLSKSETIEIESTNVDALRLACDLIATGLLNISRSGKND